MVLATRRTFPLNRSSSGISERTANADSTYTAWSRVAVCEEGGWIGAASVAALLGIGLFWLGLTLGFEILLGRVLMGYSWEWMASDYNLLKGGLLPMCLLVLTMSPLLAARVRRGI